MIVDTMRRAFSLSSAGTTYQGAWRVLVAPRQASYAFMYCGQYLRSSMSARESLPVLVRIVDAREEALAAALPSTGAEKT